MVEIDQKWLYQNIDRVQGKKEKDWNKNQWHSVVLYYMIGGIRNLTISDPQIIGDAMEDHRIDKDSFTRKFVFDQRLKDNVLTLNRCPEQVKRRRATMNCFSGTQNLSILDRILKDSLPKYFEKWSKAGIIDFR